MQDGESGWGLIGDPLDWLMIVYSRHYTCPLRETPRIAASTLFLVMTSNVWLDGQCRGNSESSTFVSRLQKLCSGRCSWLAGLPPPEPRLIQLQDRTHW